jgi:hypothetical protein
LREKKLRIYFIIATILMSFELRAWTEQCAPEFPGQRSCSSSSEAIDQFVLEDDGFAGFIEKYFLEIKSKIKKEIKDEVHLFRHMRGLKADPKKAELEEKYLERVKKYKQLKELYILEASYQQKMEVCFRLKCPTLKTEDLIIERNHYRNLKVLFLVNNPELASQKISDSLGQEDELSDKKLRKILMESSSDYLAVRKDFVSKNNNAHAGLLFFSSFARNQEELEEKQTTALLRRPYLLESLHHHLRSKDGPAPEEEAKHYCRILRLKNRFEKQELIKKVALEAGLIIGPFLFPPLSSIKIGQGLWLARFGLSAKKSEALVGAISYQVISASSGLILVNKVEVQCKRKVAAMLVKSSVEKQKEIDQCYKDLSNEYLLLAVSEAISIGRGLKSGLKLAFPKAAKLADEPGYFSHKLQIRPDQLTSKLRSDGIKSLGKDKSAFVYKTGVNEYSSIYDLEKASRLGTDHKKLTSGYWDYVADVYSKRLKLSEAEVKAFLKSSREMEDRTLLVLKSRAHPANGPPNFTGGAGIVKSSKTEELLPLEKATGFKVPREKGEKVYEVVRLVSTDADNPDHMKEILAQVMAILKTDEKASRAFVFTSKIHQRLYRKLGIPFKVIDKPNSRDVIMEFDISKVDVESL